MRMKTIIGIDPGKSGGVAVCQFGKVDCSAMPATDGDVLGLLRDIRTADVEEGGAVETTCVLEKVSGFAGKGQPGSAMFVFGENSGFIKGVAQALGMKLVLVTPQKWQKYYGLGTASACASKTVWKNKLKAEAQRRFPELRVTLATADALLIMEYGRQEQGARNQG